VDHYVDIHLKPSSEISLGHLLETVLPKLHSILALLRSGRIGSSFPRAGAGSYGSVVRLHGTRKDICALMSKPWIPQGMASYAEVSEVTPVPQGVKYRQVRRVQGMTRSKVRRQRRHLVNLGCSEQEARKKVPDSVVKHFDSPWVRFRSSSTGRSFSLRVEQGPLMDRPIEGSFNTYGLSSSGATVPWF
jgi:CRISPR-associated endonuclease Csy4